MKKIFNKIAYVVLFAIVGTACEEDLIKFDGQSRAQFVGEGSGTVIINPSEDTNNVVYVGVTSATNEDRQFTFSIDPSSTLDPLYYSIPDGIGVIPAGEVVGAIEITTFATLDFPEPGSKLILNLESVSNTEFMHGADTTLVLDFLVACAFDPAATAGTYRIIVDDFETSAGDDLFEVEAGPGDNQITLKNLFDHPNPATGEQDYDVIVDINPETGAATITKQAAWHCDNFGCAYGEGRIETVPGAGNGFVFSCLESMQFNFRHTVDAGSFGDYAFAAEKID